MNLFDAEYDKVDDYLDAHPEKREHLAKLLKTTEEDSPNNAGAMNEHIEALDISEQEVFVILNIFFI